MFEKILCLLGHAYTSDVEEGKPTPDLKGMSGKEILNSYCDHSEMRCKRCSHIYEGSIKFRQDLLGDIH